jgi:hypothetical protein
VRVADLYLRAASPGGRAGVSERTRTSEQRTTGSQGKEGADVTEAAEEGCGPGRQDGQDDEAEAEEENRTREIASPNRQPKRCLR